MNTLSIGLQRFLVWLSLLCIMASPARAASLYVTSDSVLDPMATTCTLGAPCHIDDAIRIAESNSADDLVILVAPSTFSGGLRYSPKLSDVDRDFGIRVDGGAGLFDGNGFGSLLDFESRNGDISLEGIQIQNSSGNYSSLTANAPLSVTTEGGDISLINVTMRNNKRESFGTASDAVAGARFITGQGEVSIEGSRFQNNVPGALYVDGEHVAIFDSSFLSNVTGSNTFAQGAVYLKASTVAIDDSTFQGNGCSRTNLAAGLAVAFKPAIPNGPFIDSSVSGNRFMQNDGAQCAGALSLDRPRNYQGATFVSTITVDGNLFRSNSASDAPGAALYTYLDTSSRLRARNNVIFKNETFNGPFPGSTRGSAIDATLWDDAKFYLINNTITSNPLAEASLNGGAVNIDAKTYGTQIEVYNNILVDNPTTVNVLDDSDLHIEGDRNATVTVRYNNFGAQSVFGGISSSTVDVSDNRSDPSGFVDALNEDYHLDLMSTLINAGDSSAPMLPSVDMDAQARVQSSAVDIGADEFSGVARRLVTISKLGLGAGTVASIPSGLVCEVGCGSRSTLFDDGTTIGFVAVPDSNSVFVGWSGDCSGTTPGTLLLVSGTHLCHAEFKPLTYRIVINAAGPESGSIGSTYGPSLNWVYPIGGTQRVVEDISPGTSLTISGLVTDPMTGHVFLDDCEAQGGVVGGQATSNASCSFSDIQQDHTMRVNFNSGVVLFPGRTLAITKSGLGDGTVTSIPGGIDCGSTCSNSIFVGTNVNLIATPDAQSIFAGWSGDCPAGTSSVVITMDDAKTCDAQFIPANVVDIGLSGNGSGNFADTYHGTGARYPQQSTQYVGRYPDGAAVRFEANANGSVTIVGCDNAGLGMVLLGDGTGNASCSIGSLTQSVNLEFIYAAQQSTLIVRSSGTGSGTVGTDIGGIGYSYPAIDTEQTSPITHGSNVLISASGGSGSTVYWTDCTGPGASITGEGTANSSCQIGIYQATTVNVEFRAVTVGDVFKDGFE